MCEVRSKGKRLRTKNKIKYNGQQQKEMDYMDLYNTNGFRTETMYVYYIAMKIYVLDCRNIFSTFYCLCITICLPIFLS